MVEKVWRFLDTGHRNAQFNMALDESMMILLGKGGLPPTLRVYGWSPPAVSIGYFQRVDRVVDVARCRSIGLEVVRRPTGGRAVLHWGDVTYSLVGREEDMGAEKSVVEAYRHISMALVAGLRALGANAEIQPGRRPPQHGAIQPCFSTTVRYEVSVGGRKIVGSAQRRSRGVLLQHGSLPITDDYLRIEEVLPSDYRPREKSSFESTTISLTRALDRSMAYSEVVEGIREGFRRSFGISLIPGRISQSELDLAEALGVRSKILEVMQEETKKKT